MKILVGEDEFEIANSYRLILAKRNHSVVLTANGEECKETYMNEFSSGACTEDSIPFDLVILDLKMPKRDGLEVARDILEICSEQRIVIASASPPEKITQYLQDSSWKVQVIQKPFQLRDLIDLIESDGRETPDHNLPRQGYFSISGNTAQEARYS